MLIDSLESKHPVRAVVREVIGLSWAALGAGIVLGSFCLGVAVPFLMVFGALGWCGP